MLLPIITGINIGSHIDTNTGIGPSLILLLYRGCPVSVVSLCCHGPARITELVLYI